MGNVKVRYTYCITITVKHATTWKDKIVGLIGKKKIVPLYFETRWGLHTFGVKEPIDIVILDTNGKIQVLKENLKPNRIFLWNPKYKRVIELPQGYSTKYKLYRGMKLSFWA